ncbi:MAG: hypothetical protein KatS3mg085_138 [Candidatus Dojkabacteria bacterium]|nr:MAG: hypothetical protein KatS3mg085_138 [Candidatus Dojkabacteria bacterium]
MKKAFLSILFNFLIIIIISSITVSSVVLGLFYNDSRKLNKDIQKKLDEVTLERDKLASIADESQTSLQRKIDNLENEIGFLRKENKELQNKSIDGYGKISGKITAIVREDVGVSEYQVVCAQNVDNENQIYCVGVSSLKANYVLLVPEGQYIVFTTPISSDTIGSDLRAYYTEYVACLQSNEEKCKDNDEIKIVNVKEGELTSNIDPLDII